MNAYSTIAADRSTSIQRVADRVEASLDAQDSDDLFHRHIRMLADVPLITDMPTIRQHALNLECELHFGGGHHGTLGRHGIAPAIDDCLRSARFFGFDWRERSAQA